MKTTVTVLCIVTLLLACSPASAQDNPSGGAVAIDAVLGRPACFVATIVGSALFLIALPVAATSKTVKRTADALVVTPAKATFTRPLGDFHNLRD